MAGQQAISSNKVRKKEHTTTRGNCLLPLLKTVCAVCAGNLVCNAWMPPPLTGRWKAFAAARLIGCQGTLDWTTSFSAAQTIWADELSYLWCFCCWVKYNVAKSCVLCLLNNHRTLRWLTANMTHLRLHVGKCKYELFKLVVVWGEI